MPDSRANVVRSPRLAAMGVATLSGLILHLRDKITTAIITEPVQEATVICLVIANFMINEVLCMVLNESVVHLHM